MTSDERAVAEVMARYVRATDSRNGAAMAALFVEDAVVEILVRTEKVAELTGAAAIGDAVGTMMEPHPEGGWSHHTTHDHIIEMNGDEATLDAQFVVFEVRDTIRPIESGYYRPRMRRVDGDWKIVRMEIAMDRPLGAR